MIKFEIGKTYRKPEDKVLIRIEDRVEKYKLKISLYLADGEKIARLTVKSENGFDGIELIDLTSKGYGTYYADDVAV